MQQDSPDYPYLAAELSPSERVDDLLDRMTVPEKAGQLVGTWAGEMGATNTLADVEAAIRDQHIGAAATFGWGGSRDTEIEDIVETVNRLQTVAREDTRLGIPLLFNVDAVHGHAYVSGATIFPNGLGAAATWDTDLVERAAGVTATEVRASGAHQNYSPTCDVGRDPRWGRVFETFGESPILCGEMAAAKVRGYQTGDLDGDSTVVATAKHFPAYSEPERGEDAAPVDVSEYKLRNTFVPPFERVLESGVMSAMPCYNSINGDPAHGSHHYLTTLLRDDLGFDGHIVSDWNGVRQLADDHHTASDHRDAVRHTRTAGLDIASVGHVDHANELVDLVESGDIDEDRLDESVARVLDLKFRLGLFEDPYVDAEAATRRIGTPDQQTVALESARESMTLLQNDGVLPLDDDADILVTGPNADDLVNQIGGWSVDDPAHVDGPTIREALAEATTGTVTYEPGAGITTPGDVDAAAEAASDADVAVVVLGEDWYIHEFGPHAHTGRAASEFPTRSKLTLPDAQRDLVEAVYSTGTPTVGVLVTGRPLAIPWMADTLPAILMAYYPGSRGGIAVAETLLGENDPSGRLPITIPRSTGDLPQHFDHLAHPNPIGDGEHPASYDPLYAFGHGLSYTDFVYHDLALSHDTIRGDGDLEVDVTLENVGDREGTEVVQVYSRIETSRRVQPVRRLQGFDRVVLSPGEKTTVSITIPIADFARFEPGVGRHVEPGTYQLMVDDQTAIVTIEDDD